MENTIRWAIPVPILGLVQYATFTPPPYVGSVGRRRLLQFGKVLEQAIEELIAIVTTESLLLVQCPRPCAGVVALSNADWTPEMFCGTSDGLPESMQFVRRLAEAGCLVVISTLISRNDQFPGSPYVAYTNQPHREFLYRQAFEVGRHVITYEVQKVLASTDLFNNLRTGPTENRHRQRFEIGG